MTARAAAAFDFDGTLTRRDTLLPFLASIAGPRALAGALTADVPRLGLAAAGRGDRDATKARLLRRLLQGRPYDEVEAGGRRFGARIASSWISPELRERLAWHRSRAHEIVIVSASLEVYLLEVARVLPIDCVLSTRLEVDEQGRCTGRMLGANCRGPEKAARLTAHLGDGGRLLWAYGNSRGDDEMLALARHPVRVRRGRLRD